MNRLSLGAALAVAALSFAACSASGPTPPPPPADGGTFETLEALKEAVTAAGLVCPDLVLHNDAKYSASSGSCSGDLSLAVYSNDLSLEAQVDLWKPTDRGSINVGQNWTVVSPDPKLIQQKLGGTVLQTGQ
jgi:hypothetical protein